MCKNAKLKQPATEESHPGSLKYQELTCITASILAHNLGLRIWHECYSKCILMAIANG
jgi:hypothetical protein